MITIQEAVQNAKIFLKDLVPESDSNGLRVEEIEESEDEKHWLITLGFLGDEVVAFSPQNSRQPLWGSVERQVLMVHPRRKREYKIFKIKKEDGSVENMKIREIND